MEHMHPQQDSNTTFENGSTVDMASKEQHQRLLQRGMRWLYAGAGLMALSLAINFLMFHNDQSFTYLMYVITSAGALCVMKSMADIFGI
jgi:hypothetical protein